MQRFSNRVFQRRMVPSPLLLERSHSYHGEQALLLFLTASAGEEIKEQEDFQGTSLEVKA